MEKTVERKRIVYFDVLNVLACLCVVGMHCNGAVPILPSGGKVCLWMFWRIGQYRYLLCFPVPR